MMLLLAVFAVVVAAAWLGRRSEGFRFKTRIPVTQVKLINTTFVQFVSKNTGNKTAAAINHFSVDAGSYGKGTGYRVEKHATSVIFTSPSDAMAAYMKPGKNENMTVFVPSPPSPPPTAAGVPKRVVPPPVVSRPRPSPPPTAAGVPTPVVPRPRRSWPMPGVPGVEIVEGGEAP